ncbi:MAG: VOC family protein [Geminicoccaceae bacterium]
MITGLDHIVLTVTQEAATRRFYVVGLGMKWVTFAPGRDALAFGNQKINLHYGARQLEPRAALPTPGSGDFCLLTDADLDEVASRMATVGFPVIDGPVRRHGATGPLLSLYFRDPDGNLVEVARAIEP